MEINGVPLHPLVVHAVVMLVPVAVLSGWALAFLTGWRWLTRWVALGTSVAALGAVVVARRSGTALLEDRPFLTSAESKVRDLLQTHQDRALVLFYAMIAFTVLVAVAFWVLPAASGLSTGKLEHTGRVDVRVLRLLQLLVVLVGLVALVWVVLTGDAGARSVWGS
jgi:hypothetical protein